MEYKIDAIGRRRPVTRKPYKKRAFSPEHDSLEREVARRYQAGEKTISIADDLGISRARLRWICQRLNVPARQFRGYTVEQYKARMVAKRKENRHKKLARHNRRMQTDIHYAVGERLRNRLGTALSSRGLQKLDRTIGLIGCTVREFKVYLEKLFLPGMGWHNRHLWHIDHKIPIVRFDLSYESEQREAFHYSNLQPLWAVDNLRKGAKWGANVST